MPTLQTPLCDLLKIDVPIIQAPLPLCRACGLREFKVHHQAVPVLHQHMSWKRQLRLVASILARQTRLRVGCRDVGDVGAALAVEVDVGIAALTGWGDVPIPRFEALDRSPALKQRPVHGEVVW